MTSLEGKRKTSVYLSDQQLYAIYKRCIEKKDVIQNGDATRYRVIPKIIADEINEDGGVDGLRISDHHVRRAVERVVDWQIMLGELPEPQQTVYEDQLQAQIKGLNIEKENLKLEIQKLKDQLNGSGLKSDLIKQARVKCAELSRILHSENFPSANLPKAITTS